MPVTMNDLEAGEVYSGDDVDTAMREVVSRGSVKTDTKLLGPLIGALIRLRRKSVQHGRSGFEGS